MDGWDGYLSVKRVTGGASVAPFRLLPAAKYCLVASGLR